MGVIKYNGKVIYEGSFASASFAPNWNNSMQSHYPHISVRKFKDGLSTFEYVCSDVFGDVSWAELDIQPDLDQAEALKAHYARLEAETESKVIRKGKFVEIFKGRKYPIGLIGQCFWVGESGYGTSVGLRREDTGERIFVSISNCRVVGQRS